MPITHSVVSYLSNMACYETSFHFCGILIFITRVFAYGCTMPKFIHGYCVLKVRNAWNETIASHMLSIHLWEYSCHIPATAIPSTQNGIFRVDQRALKALNV